MIEVSLKPNGSGIQFDNFLDKLLRDEDHRGVAHCMLKANRGHEDQDVIKLIRKRAKRRKGGLQIGSRVLGTEELQDRWCEVTVEVWLQMFNIEKPLSEVTMRDLKPVLALYDDEQAASITLITSRIFDGFPEVRSIETVLNDLLTANQRPDVQVRTRRAHWSPGFQIVTLRFQPPSEPELELGDDYPIPSPV